MQKSVNFHHPKPSPHLNFCAATVLWCDFRKNHPQLSKSSYIIARCLLGLIRPAPLVSISSWSCSSAAAMDELNSFLPSDFDKPFLLHNQQDESPLLLSPYEKAIVNRDQRHRFFNKMHFISQLLRAWRTSIALSENK